MIISYREYVVNSHVFVKNTKDTKLGFFVGSLQPDSILSNRINYNKNCLISPNAHGIYNNFPTTSDGLISDDTSAGNFFLKQQSENLFYNQKIFFDYKNESILINGEDYERFRHVGEPVTDLLSNVNLSKLHRFDNIKVVTATSKRSADSFVEIIYSKNFNIYSDMCYYDIIMELSDDTSVEDMMFGKFEFENNVPTIYTQHGFSVPESRITDKRWKFFLPFIKQSRSIVIDKSTEEVVNIIGKDGIQSINNGGDIILSFKPNKEQQNVIISVTKEGVMSRLDWLELL